MNMPFLDFISSKFLTFKFRRKLISDRLTSTSTKVQYFDSLFLKHLLSGGTTDKTKMWVSARKINLMDKQLLCFPFKAQDDWSLFIVLNPGHIMASSSSKSKSNPKLPMLLYLDPLGTNSKVDQNSIARLIRNWLNNMYPIQSKNPYTQERPYTKYTLGLCRVDGKLTWLFSLFVILLPHRKYVVKFQNYIDQVIVVCIF